MKLIKNVRTIAGDGVGFTAMQLERQRKNMSFFSRLAASRIIMSKKRFFVCGMPCELIIPLKNKNHGKVILYCHGGGFTCGDLEYAGVIGSKLAEFTYTEVITFEYRLAPEYNYPAPLHDAARMWHYLELRGYRPEDIILAGDSAGGNIVLELTLALRKKQKKPAGLLLFSPFTDMTLSSDSYEEWKDYDPILTKEYVKNVRDLYIVEQEADYKDAKYSPLYADLNGFPPTLVQVGSNEILRDDSRKLVQKIRKAGGYAVLQTFEGGWHVFQQMPVLMAADAMRKTELFVQSLFS